MMKTIIPVLAVGLLLGACEAIVHEPTSLNQSKIQIIEDTLYEDVSVQELDSAAIAGLSKHYTRYGEGQIDLSVTYDPRSKTSTAMHASNEIARISSEFYKNGIENVVSNIIPVKGQGDASRALISFTVLEASAPEDCETMPGLKHHNIDIEEDYKLGCSMQTLVAKQIARPKDLKGRVQTDATSDGRRAGNVLDAYRAGIPNEPLEGETATE